jgi:N-acetylglutamate synthase-like GNAT family acetyltransferase
MKKIEFINDHNLYYNKEIINRLQKFNISQRGYREKDFQHFYVFEDDNLIGVCHTKLASDWCHIVNIYYQDKDVLKALLNDLIVYYDQRMIGVQYQTIIPQRVEDFTSLNFERKGALKDMPEGGENVFLILKDYQLYETDNDYHMASTDRPIKEHSKIMKAKNRAIRKKLNYSSEKVDVQYVVLTDGQFIGGIYGNIQYDFLFINILFVDEDYRGLSIATKLMELIEEEANRRDVYNIYITTFEFQALDFYKKHGYKIVMIIDDYPVGYKEYTVYKKLPHTI